MKFCSKCGIAKPFEMFYRMAKSPDGHKVHCKLCMQAHLRQWTAKNRGKVKGYLVKRRDHLREYNKEYHAKNKDRRKQQMRDWGLMNRPITRYQLAKYRATKLQATPAWINHEKVAEFYFAADFLSMVTGEWHHVDHAVPLRSDLVCGLHWEANLQVLTATENLAKGNRLWPDMP